MLYNLGAMWVGGALAPASQLLTSSEYCNANVTANTAWVQLEDVILVLISNDMNLEKLYLKSYLFRLESPKSYKPYTRNLYFVWDSSHITYT